MLCQRRAAGKPTRAENQDRTLNAAYFTQLVPGKAFLGEKKQKTKLNAFLQYNMLADEEEEYGSWTLLSIS